MSTLTIDDLRIRILDAEVILTAVVVFMFVLPANLIRGDADLLIDKG
jgi:hypothetical protein